MRMTVVGSVPVAMSHQTIHVKAQQTINSHLETPSHIAKRQRYDEAAESDRKRQATISGSSKRITEARDARNGPQRQSFTDANLAIHVKHAFNAKQQ